MLAAVEKKETLSETAVAVESVSASSIANKKHAQRQILKEMAQQKKFGLEKEEKKEEYQQSKQKDIEALRDPSTDEKTKKAHIKALRIKAVEEAMKEKTKNAAKSEPMAEEEAEDDFEEDDDELDPSSLVEAEMDENYEDTLVEVNIPGKNSSWTFKDVEVNIAGDDVLLPPTADGKVFCTICKGGPMQVATIPFNFFL